MGGPHENKPKKKKFANLKNIRHSIQHFQQPQRTRHQNSKPPNNPKKNKINTAMPGSLIASKILTRTWHIKSSPAREAFNKYYSFNFKSEIQHKWSNATIDYSKIQSTKKKKKKKKKAWPSTTLSANYCKMLFLGLSPGAARAEWRSFTRAHRKHHGHNHAETRSPHLAHLVETFFSFFFPFFLIFHKTF